MKRVHLLLLALSTNTICHVRSEEENVSIVTDGDALTATQTEVSKRTQANKFEELPPVMFERVVESGGYNRTENRALLDAHNNYRRMTPASDMNELLWSPALAEQAQTWSDGCFYEHPDRSRHSDYEGIGQNLYIRWRTGTTGRTDPPPLTDPVYYWYGEVENFNYDTNSCKRNAVCGHYTQVVWAKTTKVGCGIKFCPLAWSYTSTYPNAWLVTCNYRPRNALSKKPYKSGKPCSECEKGFCRNNLCSKCKPRQKGCERCEDKNPKCGANPGWPKFWCDDERFSYVKESCPALCGQCTKGPASC